ncbi:RHOMBOID-like protein 10, chloroplastic [Triticum dicoccoides]|uniref:RHOMBOID-like protein 10, chloroplastic n=1 Tax=Triticum dicoccoides TaxID=85692 RepID=UPI0018903072|nr:RHOMBOID-like protein 10, chloroplastic [Triticum dicoccoides]
MATRLLLRLRSISPPLPPAHIPGSCSSAAQLGNCVLHCSPPGMRELHVLPRAVPNNSRWFGGGSRWHSSSSKPPRPRSILTNVLFAASFSAAGLLIDDTSSEDKQKSPPMGPIDTGSNKKKTHKRDCTNALLAINVMVYVVDVAARGRLSLCGAMVNSLALHDIGPMVEEVTGPARFLTIYFTSALAGSLMSYCAGIKSSVGASTAICGLIGAQAVYMWRHRNHLEKTNVTLGRIAFDVVINVGVGLYVMKRIDNWGHLGGLLAGVVVECFVGPHWKKLGVAEDRTKVIQDRAPLAWLTNGGIRPQKTVFTETEEGLFAK